ncbi:glycosyltransferase family 4 protein [Achromobacter sp. NPDC058515]|uniref:glycosyltransferase family 4 protein n=1 Tax=Achromobacter sp. NPDC058515 TaxID=3346533 RepID=UPI003647C1EF
MQTTCFVSYELFPVTRGGCGALLHNLAVQLLQSGGRVVFLLDVDADVFARFDEDERLKLPNPQNCVAYRVEDMCGKDLLPRESFASWYEWRSYVLNVAALKVHQLERPALIEFFDYHGVAYYALCEKLALGGYEGARIAVRYHATIEAMDRVDLTNSLHPELYLLYSLERAALALADTVIVPSESVSKRSLADLYPTVADRQVVAVPPLQKTLNKRASDGVENGILFYGRLFSIKGVDLLVDAAVLWMRQRPELSPDFYFVGGDSKQPPDGGGLYADYLLRRIPLDLRGRFHILGHLSHEETEALLEKVRFAVFPNRAESFCYAAHELYAGGVPVIVSDIPGFEDFFQHERNSLVFDCTSSDALTAAIGRLWDDGGLRKRLTFPYPVVPTGVAPIYEHAAAAPAGGAVSAAAPGFALSVIVQAETLAQAQPLCMRLAEGGHKGIVLLPALGADSGVSAFLLGRNVRCVDPAGASVDLHALRTTDALVVLNANDVVDPLYLDIAVRVLSTRADVPFVSGWSIRNGSGERRADTYSLPLALDTAPLSGRNPGTRAVFRTQPGQLILDTFDTGLAEYAELKHLWKLTRNGEIGLLIPRALLELPVEEAHYPSAKQVSYLLNGDDSVDRRKRLSQSSIAVWNCNAFSNTPAATRRMLQDVSALPPELLRLLLRMGNLVVAIYQRCRPVRPIMGFAKRLLRRGSARVRQS